MAVLARPEAEAEQLPAVEPIPAPRRIGVEQMGVAVGQLAAGFGNLVFSLVVARILDPPGFAHLSAFLGLYLLLSLPATSLSAAAAISPADRGRRLRRVRIGSLAFGLALIGLSPFVAQALNLSTWMIVALGLATPATGPLAFRRGQLYGQRRHVQVVASLLAEPVVRLGLGVGLAATLGGAGGAVAVVVAAYAASEVARRRRPLHRHSSGARLAPPGAAGVGAARAGWTAAAFALLAVVQNQDLLFANRLLPPAQAGAYAALSTLGGAAAFATLTVPLVLLPRAVRRERHALGVALGLAGALGASAVLIGAAAPHQLLTSLFGPRYGAVTDLVVPYLAAMAMLGVARVLLAYRCAIGAARGAVLLTAAVAAAQAVAIDAIGDRTAPIAWSTVAATGTLTVALGAAQVIRLPSLRAWVRTLAKPVVVAVASMTAIGLAIRLVVLRGIWLDEATSIYEAGLSFHGMLRDLRTSDVHPPLYFSILWVTDRVAGNGTLAMRMPSIIAGTLIVPALYVAGRDLWDRRTGTVAAAIGVVGPILVWYSQEARMYSMFMLFAVLAVWGQIRAIRRGRAADWAIYALASAALGWIEYFGLFQVAAQQLVFVGVAWSSRKDRRYLLRLLAGWAAAAIGILALLAPLAPFAWHQFVVNQQAGKGFGTPSQVGLSGTQSMSIYTVLANLTWAVLGYQSAPAMAALVALWPLGILLSLVLLGRRSNSSTYTVLVSAVVPTLLLVAVGMVKRNLLDIRYISGVVMMLQLLLARLITGVTRSLRLQAVACLALVVILAGAMFDEQVNGSNPRRYDFSTALSAIAAEYRPGDVLVYDPGDLQQVVQYYAPRVRSGPYGSIGTHVASGHRVFVMASRSLMHVGQYPVLMDGLSRLGRHDQRLGVAPQSNVTVWTFQARGAA